MRISDWSSDVGSSDLDTESLGEILGGRPAIDIVFERDAFVGRVHRHPLKIFGKARFGRNIVVVEDEYLHRVIGRQITLVDQELERAQASPSRLHREDRKSTRLNSRH